MNILILSCGTRYKLVEYFKKCTKIEKVICSDVSELAPALLAADVAYIVPKMTDVRYLDRIIEICKKESVNAVLPLHEEELLLISKNKKVFADNGILPIISDYQKVLLCKDKYELSQYLSKSGISAVESFLAEEYVSDENKSFETFFVKPRTGAGSVDTYMVHSKKMLKAIMEEYDEDFIVQPAIIGKEYGVDVYVDMISGEVISFFCKEKLRMRAGETEKSLSVRNEEIENLVKEAVIKIGLRGPIDIDVLEKDGKFFILEINPRFGGGYPHAYECGVDFPVLIANNCANDVNKDKEPTYEENIIGMKYSDIVVKKK